MDSLNRILTGLLETVGHSYKPQRQFLLTLCATIFVVCGKVNYTNHKLATLICPSAPTGVISSKVMVFNALIKG